MASVTFPAAPTPAGVRSLRRAAAAIAGALLVWAAVVTRGTGVGWLLAVVALLCAAPALWQLGMTPQAYTVEGDRIHVHRRWLPDSIFRMRGTPERLAAAEARAPISGRGQEGYGDGFARLSRTRVLSALTDARKGVRVTIGRGGALLISPEDPDAFVRAASGGRFP